MSQNRRIVIAFDAYGTLLSTESIAEKLSEHFGKDKGKSIAQSWRKYQLEYTFRLNSMNTYVDFEQVTKGSLRNALLEADVSLNDDEIADMMKAYDSLTIFPDVAETLELLRKKPQIYPVVFSNGTLRMVSTSVKESPDLKAHKDVLRDVVVVEQPRRFKPAPEVYNHLQQQVEAQQMSDMWLVSGNPFDIVGARTMGMHACWVDRAGAGWRDHILEGDAGKPTKIVKNLTEVVDIVCSHYGV